jgi:hypothetical protein
VGLIPKSVIRYASLVIRENSEVLPLFKRVTNNEIRGFRWV